MPAPKDQLGSIASSRSGSACTRILLRCGAASCVSRLGMVVEDRSRWRCCQPALSVVSGWSWRRARRIRWARPFTKNVTYGFGTRRKCGPRHLRTKRFAQEDLHNVDANLRRPGQPSKAKVVRCPYCVEDDEFKAMTGNEVGDWYICDQCGHLALTTDIAFECTCSKCARMRVH